MGRRKWGSGHGHDRWERRWWTINWNLNRGIRKAGIALSVYRPGPITAEDRFKAVSVHSMGIFASSVTRSELAILYAAALQRLHEQYEQEDPPPEVA